MQNWVRITDFVGHFYIFLQCGMQHQASDTFLVVGEGANAFSSRQIPEANGRIVAAGDDLWISGLWNNAGDGVGVAH